MTSFMCNFLVDWGRSIKAGLGPTWTVILLCFFACMFLYLMQNIFRASINKTKLVFKWGQIFFMIVFLLLTIWFCTIL